MPKFCKFLIILLAFLLPGLAHAKDNVPQIRLDVQSREMAFGGQTFGDRGTYERIIAIAHMRIDPLAEGNRAIVDLALAPRASDGMVEYETDVIILRPQDPAKAKRVMIYDVVNRGMRLMSMMSGGSFDPNSPGDGQLMREGVTIVASGWQSDVNGGGRVAARFPVAAMSDGPITGRISTERIFDDLTTNRIDLPYAAASLDQANARLTVRARGRDDRVEISAANWNYGDNRHIIITRPAAMDAGAIYRFEYVARDPVVMGLGFAATRDIIAWLRHAPASSGNPLAELRANPCERDAKGKCANPDGGAFSSAIAFGGSQSGRYLRDFLWQGFNRGFDGKRVFDGVIPFVPGGRQTFTNFRFAEPGRFSRQHEDHDVPGFTFPFAYSAMTDPVTGRRDGILQSCTQSDTCPRVFHVDTSGEFWQAGSSLVGTGGTSRDIDFPDNVRAYMIAGGAHAPGMTMPSCKFSANPLNYTPIVQALIMRMVEWSSGQAMPPESRWPRIDTGELVTLGQMEFPKIASLDLQKPDVINRPVPPATRPDWPIHVPAVDADGNDIGGIRMPALAAPTGTFLPWNFRKAGFAENEFCLVFGSYFPFAETDDAKGDDPRRSMSERYPEAGARERLYDAAIEKLVREGFLLEENAGKLRDAAEGE